MMMPSRSVAMRFVPNNQSVTNEHFQAIPVNGAE
jgi:hypothetical protein